MNARFVTFSLATAVGICFAASQLSADELAQPDEVAQDAGEPLASDACRVERTVLEAWMICGAWMPYEEAIAVDEVIEPIIANENEPQESEAGLGDASGEIVCADEVIESEEISVAEEAIADELLESDENVSDEAEQVEISDVQIFEEVAAEDLETTEAEITEAEIFANEELTEEAEWGDGFCEWYGDNEFAAEEVIDETTTVEETVEAAEVEDNVEVVESVVEEAIGDDVTDNMENDAAEDLETTEAEIFANEELTEEAEWGDGFYDDDGFYDEWYGDNEFAAEEVIDETTTVEETVEAIEDVASPAAVEASEEESFEQEVVEEVQRAGVESSVVEEDNIDEQVFEDVASDAYEDVTTDGVVDNEETLTVAEPLVEQADLQAPGGETIVADEVHESEAGTIRTFELHGCTVTIQSERQLDDFELLGMLWEAVDQLEAEMD